MKLAQNKKIKSYIVALAAGLSLLGIVAAPKVALAGDPSLPDPTRAMCYNQAANTADAIDLSVEGAADGCTSAGGSVIRGGEPTPVPICVLQTSSNTGSFSHVTVESVRAACAGTGGYIIEAGGSIPKLNAAATPGSNNNGTQAVECDTEAEKSAGGACTGLRSDCKGDISKENCGITRLIIMFINILSGMVAVTVVVVMIIAGIQYSSSAGDPQAAAAAKKRISNALLALVVFAFMYSLIQWLVPGGVFS